MLNSTQTDVDFRDKLLPLMPALYKLNKLSSLNDLFREAIRIGREILQLERCGIGIIQDDMLRGTWGVDQNQIIVDEQSIRSPINPIIQDVLKSDFKQLYQVSEDTDQFALVNGSIQVIGRGWVACTPIHSGSGTIFGLFFNDTALTGTPSQPEQQNVVAIFCAYLGGVAERLETESALADSESRFKSIAQQTQEIFWTTNVDGSAIYYLSPAFETIWGHSVEEAYQQPSIWLDAILPEYQKIVAKKFLAHAARGDFDEIYPIRRADGQVRWVRDRGFPVRDASGEVIRVTGITSDVTDQVTTEEKLRDTEALYKNLIHQLPAVTYVVSLGTPRSDFTKHRTIYISPQVEEMFGYTAAEWLADSDLWLRLVHPGDKERILKEINLANVEGKNFRLEYRTITKRGEERWIHNQALYPDDAPALETKHIQGCMFDITEEKQAHQHQQDLLRKLAKAERMESIGMLAGSVAHDLNNILGPVIGYPDLLLDEIPSGETRFRKDLVAVRDSARKAADVIQDLLNLARRENYELAVIDLNHHAKMFLESPTLESMLLSHPNTRLRMEIPSDPMFIEASIPHLNKLLMNLIINGSESMAEGGQITVSTALCQKEDSTGSMEPIEPGEYACLSVTDEGSGISTNDLSKIFEPFYTTKDMGRSGTGLGLSVVYGVVKDFYGYIDVTSPNDEGTTFNIYIPVSNKKPETPPKEPEAIPGGGRRVLVIDDLPEQRALAERLLTRLGYDVDTAVHGHDALEYFQQGKRAEILMLDMIMEDGFDGLDTYRAILELAPGQKCLIVSGYSATERVQKAIDLGAGMYISKPYSLQKLSLALQRVLTDHSLV